MPLSHNTEVLLTRQRHEADRAGLHFDYRIVVGDKAYSWATKKGLPEPGKSILLHEQPIHTAHYALSERVEIPKGVYGAGVTTLDWVAKGKINNPEEDPEKFTIHLKDGQRFLIKKLPEKYGPKAWLFRNLTAVEKQASDLAFEPDLTPDEMKRLGVLAQQYFGADPKKANFFHVDASLKHWPDKWIDEKTAPMGWFDWYQGYAAGRRTPDDERQIKRWISFKARHLAQLRKADPSLTDLSVQPRRRQALLNWGIAPGGKNMYLSKIAGWLGPLDNTDSDPWDEHVYTLEQEIHRTPALKKLFANKPLETPHFSYDESEPIVDRILGKKVGIKFHEVTGWENRTGRTLNMYVSDFRHLYDDHCIVQGMHKAASLVGGAIATHLAQNVGTRVALKSKTVSKYLANAFAQGSKGVVDNSIKGRATRFLSGAALPDVAVAHKKMHDLGRTMKPILDVASKRQQVAMRMMSQGRFADLKKYNLHKDPVVRKGYEAVASKLRLPGMDDVLTQSKKIGGLFQDKTHPLLSNIAKNISKGEVPMGKKFKPGSLDAKAPIAGAAASALVDPAGGAINSAKTLMGSKKFSDTKLGNKLNKMLEKQFVVKPIQHGVEAGKVGKAVEGVKHKAYELGVNPVSAHLKRTSAAITDVFKSQPL